MNATTTMPPLWFRVLIPLLTVIMAAQIVAHVPWVNGPRYAQYPWRRLAVFPLYPAMVLGAVPFFVGQLAYFRLGRVKLALGLVALSTLALQLIPIPLQPHPPGINRLAAIVISPINTSYYTDAVVLAEQENISVYEWVYQYPDLLPLFHMHAQFKPPGLVLYYFVLVKLLGEGVVAATVGGLIIALLAAAAVPATYWMLKFFGGDREAAFCGASYLALMPSLVLFVPQFDQVYPAAGCVLLVLWGTALLRNSYRAAAAFGVLLALALFFSYIFLVVGAFLASFTILFMGDNGRRGVRRAIASALLALGGFAAVYLLLWVMSGFDPVATFGSISRTQMKILVWMNRPFPRHMIFDPIEMALGTGFLSVVLIASILLALGRTMFNREARSRLILLALFQVVTTLAAALFPGETARLYLVMMPLLMAPIGFELARWPVRWRMVVYGCLLLLTMTICQNINFIYMGVELDGPR